MQFGRAESPAGILNKALYGETPFRGPTPYPLYTISDRKGTPFVYLPLKNGAPFTYQLKNTASLF